VSALAGVEDLVLLIVVSLIPALAYLAWVRKGERRTTEGWGTLLRGFLYGAIFATIVAGVLELVVVSLGTSVSQHYPAPEFVFLNGNSTAGSFFLVLVIAPFIEEALKASGVAARRANVSRLADGPVIGASVGLGFGFFETFLYGLGAFLVGGLVAGLFLILVRSLSSVLLHGSSTGMFGYGYARSKFGVPGPGSGGYYLLAVGMHATFNALASASVILALVGITGVAQSLGADIALFAAIAFAIGAITHVRDVTQAADYPALLPRPPATVARPPSRPPAQGSR
jgi:RsiW-degrading membrane proteinase PrsW (M82 family)